MIVCLKEISGFPKVFLAVLTILFTYSISFGQTTYTVTSTADTPDSNLTDNVCADENGDCTFRAALQNANKTSQKDNIVFNITGQGPYIIQPSTPLPSIANPIIISGRTQNGYEPGLPVIEFDGRNEESTSPGFSFLESATASEVYGLSIYGFMGVESEAGGNVVRIGGSGIFIRTSDMIIAGNLIGLTPRNESIGNDFAGIAVASGMNNLIGGTNPEDRNIISGNRVGVDLASRSAATGENTVIGNYIGTDITGMDGMGNRFNLQIRGSSGNQIGGVNPNEGNVISGSLHESEDDGVGIVINYIGESIFSENNVIQGNLIGTNKDGTGALPNYRGINFLWGSRNNIIGGKIPEARNIVSGNFAHGIYFQGSDTRVVRDNIIEGNYVGVQPDGSTPLPNRLGFTFLGGTEQNLIGGTEDGSRNIISGNTDAGIRFQSNQSYANERNKILGNIIGLNAEGISEVPNGNGILFIMANYLNEIGNGESNGMNIISGNRNYGVIIEGGRDNFIDGNLIGVSPSGDSPMGNGRSGIIVFNSTGNKIGSSGASIGNTISGNSEPGIIISGEGSTNNSVMGNFIGTDSEGNFAISNAFGISISNASMNSIGGAKQGEGNLISGNNNAGIRISGAAAKENVIIGNKIGTDLQGVSAIPNGINEASGQNSGSGIIILNSSSNRIGGETAASRNLISGNVREAIAIAGIGGDNNLIQGNFLGTDINGTSAIANQRGIVISNDAEGNIVGGYNESERNVISGNTIHGITLGTGASQNKVLGNFIGTDVTGTLALGNEASGLFLSGVSDNFIGEAREGAKNIVSGNGTNGIWISNATGESNAIHGNYVGTDVSGTIAIGNRVGVYMSGGNSTTVGGTNQGESNLISGNLLNGMFIFNSNNNRIAGNYIGTSSGGIDPLPNNQNGVLIFGSSNDNVIGGLNPGEANTIAHNGASAVLITRGPQGNVDPQRNKVSGNHIFSNQLSGIGLDTPGITPNDPGDADTGPNQLQNFPEIAEDFTVDGNQVSLRYFVPSSPDNSAYPIQVEFFKDGGNRQGRTLVFVDQFTEMDYSNGQFKTLDFSLPTTITFQQGDNILATATDTNGNTSEFGGAGTEFDLTMEVHGEGSVTSDPDRGSHYEGSDVVLTASPSPGWVFDRWEGDLTGSTNPAILTMESDRSVTAVFIQQTYNVTTDTQGSGTLVTDPEADEYTHGTEVTLTAVPSTGWEFVRWEGDLTGAANPITFTMEGNRSVTAIFIQQTFNLTAETQGNGTLEIDPQADEYTYGTEVTLTANPGMGWEFDRWEGDLTGSTVSATISMDEARSVTAIFVEIEYPLSINIDGNGQVGREPEGEGFTHGSVVNLTANSEEGWVFVRWEGDLEGNENPAMILMDQEKNISAVFVRTLDAEPSVVHTSCPGGSDGSITITPSGGTAPYLFDWGNLGSTEQGTLSNLSAGIYPVTVTDTNGLVVSLEAVVLDTETSGPVPDLDELPVIVENSMVNALVPPTATHACDGSITGITDVEFPIMASTTITWTFTDSFGNSVSQKQEIRIEVEEIILFPNPVIDEGFRIAFPPSSVGIRYTATLYAAGGSLIAEREFEIGESSNSFRWDIDHVDWSSGAYILVLRSSEGMETIKLLKLPR